MDRRLKPASSLDNSPDGSYFSGMTAALPPALTQLVERLLLAGRYADEGEVVREALRVLERQEFDESPALEAALLEGARAPHSTYDAAVLDRIRASA